METLKKNQVFKGQVVDLTHEGHGVVKIDRYPVFVPKALTGEEIEFKLIKVNKNFAIGKLLEIFTESKDRVEPPCVYYDKCGGCQLQHLDYLAQLEMKRNQVVNLFHRKGKFTSTPINETIGMMNPWNYRNKSQIPVGQNSEDAPIMGFYRQRSHDIIDMEECLIQDSIQNQLMRMIRALLTEHNVSVYDEKRKEGLLRHVIIRVGYTSREVMVVFVTNGKKFKQAKAIIKQMVEAVPNIKSVIQNINETHSNVIMGKKSKTLYGKDEITDELDSVEFEISDQSFYQINASQTVKLYNKALEYAGLTGEETVLDTYCGIGTIGLYMAEKAKHVYGVEVVPAAIEDAKKNDKLNGYDNTTFVCGKAESVIMDWKQQGIQPDVVMVDPPRKGCDEQFLRTLLELNPQRIVYISCNPSTQQRDAHILAEGYELKEITPVDMFPQTTHIETVALFERK
ncbi:23S rRNA (uracil(1939)-C(5))-methyltransferase RlmD [Staphylococcus sp. IVB6181]|uniref:23S rRNA (uracil(1939)-C(5))-methyltransferase RlmD n=1 Tax=Staphylococcus sp. IVB6181 TaxID=2929481 RepID=UPI0021D24A6F|nr:23S rRNA (uracil(1939)-C(5))-methyltransferase RlmD [Staphylococcus sp. IVB6181]UXV35893.1 23S rRNA (uracil(1939)-C(5))-methyltransferase RlmD [Staphylococcus sp. IVB6181]